MMRDTKLLFALVALFAVAMAGCNKLQARDNLNKGVRAFKEARYEDAVAYFRQAMEFDPELTSAELYLATAYSQQFVPGAMSEENYQHAENAIVTFQTVLERESNNISAIAGLASIYQNTDRVSVAREYYLQHAELEPENAQANYSVGSVNWILAFDKNNPMPPDEREQLISQGQEHLDKALELDEDYENAMSYKNLLYRSQAEMVEDEVEKERLLAEADRWFNAALDARKRNAEQQGVIGIILEQ